MAGVVKEKFEEAEKAVISAAEMVAAMPAVKAAFADKNRNDLLAVTQDIFKIQHEKYGISIMQFHSPELVTFLRVHNPPKFGEDLTTYRPMIVDVNRNLAARRGVEITTSGVSVIGALPMTDQAGKYDGSFEVGTEFGPLLDEIKAGFGFELAVYMNEKILQTTATGLKGEVFSETNRVGKFVKFYTTHPELLSRLVTDAEIDVKEDTTYVKDALGNPYGVFLTPLYNYAHQAIGIIAVTQKFTATRSSSGQSLITQILAGSVVAILLIGLILIVIRGAILGPLKAMNQALKALEAGDDFELADTKHFPTELAVILESYRALKEENDSKGRNQ